MTSVVGLVALTVSAVVATAVWAAEAAATRLVRRENALALTSWGLLSAAAGVTGLVTGRPTHPGALALLLAAAACAAVGVAGAVRLAAVPGTLAPAAAEAVLVAGGAVGVFWALAGPDSAAGVPWTALALVVLATVHLTTAALVVRAPVATAPSAGDPLGPAFDRRYRPVVATGLLALAVLVVGDALLAVADLHAEGLADAGLLALALGHLLAAAAPFVPPAARAASPATEPAAGPEAGPVPGTEAGRRAEAGPGAGPVPRAEAMPGPGPTRPEPGPGAAPSPRQEGGPATGPPARPAPTAAVPYLPYAPAALAVVALLAAGFAGRGGVVSLLLVAFVACGLAGVQLVTLRRNARLRHDVAEARSRLQALAENTSDVVLGVDPLGRVTSANTAALRLLHRTPAAMAGLELGELAAPEQRARLRAAVDDVVHRRRAVRQVEVRLAAPATGTAQLRLRGVSGGVVVNLSDVTESVRLRERLDRLARYDDLTGLTNRVHLLEGITGWLRAGLRVAVLYCDLDGFKAVNDRFGHVHGDAVLAEAARRLHEVADGLPGEDRVVARVGDDEFVVAVVDPPQDRLGAAAEKLLAVMRPTFAVADRAVRVGLSVGVAASWDAGGPPAPVTSRAPGAWPAPDDVAADGLLHRADVAMFAAKQEGRSRAVRWDPGIHERALRRVDIAIGLRRALDSRRLALAYQPLVRLSDGAIVGVEALLRVAAGDDAPGALAGLPGLVSPAELVAVAEDTGEITEVGHWVLTEATAQAARWRRLGHDVQMNVNVSVRQLEAENFAASVRQALDAAGLPAAALVLEITEGQLLSEGDPAWDTVARLRDAGVMLVIDDFGSGYSSLAYLRRMPVRGVKLDRELIADLATDGRARTLARAVIAAARALGLLVVAEGLETLEAARIVRDLGAWAGQGFALYEAMPADEVTGVLARPPGGLGTGTGRARTGVRAPGTADLT